MGLEKLPEAKRLEISKMGSQASAKARTIQDKYTALPISRQRKYLLRQKDRRVKISQEDYNVGD